MPRWLKFLLLALFAAVLLLASLPWWLGAALHPILRSQGVAFASYERVGYAHFRLRDVNYLGTSYRVDARKIETVTPVLWAFQWLRGAGPLVVAENWAVTITPPPVPSPVPPPNPDAVGMPELQAVLLRIVPPLRRWLPRAELKAGAVRGPGWELAIAHADWKNAALALEGLGYAHQVGALTLTPAADGTIGLAAHTAGSDLQLQLTWTNTEMKGAATVLTQPVQLAAKFPAHGWLPAEASATATHWELPAARLKLGTPYARVRGDARFTWKNEAFDLSAEAKAEPAADNKSKVPPLEARATARGDLHELMLTAFHVDAPFATAKLSAPITFSVAHPPAGASAGLSVQADLAKMPWFEARGKIDGTVTVTGNDAAARQGFELKFRDVAFGDFSAKSAEARGTLVWPRLEITGLNIQLDENTVVESHGVVDWQTRELSGVALQGRFAPESFARWLPKGTTWTSAEISATAEGPLDAPRHAGSLKLTGAQHPPLQPVAIDAEWKGQEEKLEITAHVAAKTSTLDLAGSFDPRVHGLELTKLTFAPGGQLAWQLTAPAKVTWSPAWQVDNFQATAAGSHLAFSGKGGPEGSWSITAAHFSSAWLQDWMNATGPNWELNTLSATGRVADGALVFDANLAGQIEMAPRPATVSVIAHGDVHGVELKELKVVEGERVLTQASGRLPVALVMAPAPHLFFDEAAPLQFTASTEPESPLWATLTAYTGLQLTSPTAQINLKGTLRQPAGDLQVKVTRLSAAPDRFKFPVPDFDDLALAMQLGRAEVTLTNFSAKLDGQAVEASGRLPMNDDGWLQLWRMPREFDWRKATARVAIPGADLAPLARRFPKLVAAQGRLRGQVELAAGGKFSGELHLTDAATRPLPALGSFQDINADLSLADRVITVQKLTAKLGGEPVTLDGTITLAPDGNPRLALALKGTNLPLVRNTGLLLRSDIDLHATTDAAGTTRLSGALNIRDCLVLANLNLRTLLPSGRHGITRQPPYFSVPADPFRTWPLAVTIRAPGVVRVRTTIYNGIASAVFQLGGTLGEPRAVGQLTVDQGQLLFPFATFKVQQGAVRLREADPFHAAVSLNATSQRRDYQMRLEMTGELPEPNVIITSTPPLEAADVLLMVMTGQPPSGDVTNFSASGQRLALLGAYLSRGLFQDLGFNGEDRLEISAGEHISRAGRETYLFEYKLSEKVSLEGEYDEFDAYNAGVKWRVYTEEGAPLEKKK